MHSQVRHANAFIRNPRTLPSFASKILCICVSEKSYYRQSSTCRVLFYAELGIALAPVLWNFQLKLKKQLSILIANGTFHSAGTSEFLPWLIWHKSSQQERYMMGTIKNGNRACTIVALYCIYNVKLHSIRYEYTFDDNVFLLPKYNVTLEAISSPVVPGNMFYPT